MSNTIAVGKVLRPRGLRGEVKVQILTNRFEVFAGARAFIVKGKSMRVLKSSIQNGFAYVTFDGVGSAEDAEKLRLCLLEINRSELPLGEDEVLSGDLIGFRVVGTKGRDFGRVTAINNYGAGEVIETPHVSFPNEDSFVAETNLTTRTITVNEAMLDEEVVL